MDPASRQMSCQGFSTGSTEGATYRVEAAVWGWRSPNGSFMIMVAIYDCTAAVTVARPLRLSCVWRVRRQVMKRQILVVEDDVSLARILCDNLVYEGFDVALATDGHSALTKAGALNVDLVLLDLMLPKLS